MIWLLLAACALALAVLIRIVVVSWRSASWTRLIRLRDAQLDCYTTEDSPLQQSHCYGCGSYDRPVCSYRFADGVATTVAALCSPCARKRHATLIGRTHE